MKAFQTLLWLELRKGWKLCSFLAIVLVGWAAFVPSVYQFADRILADFSAGNVSVQTDAPEYLSELVKTTPGMDFLKRMGVLCVSFGGPGLIGLIAIGAFFLNVGKEGKTGHLQLMLMTPRSGYFHVFSRFGFLLLVAICYFFPLFFISWVAHKGPDGLIAANIPFAIQCAFYVILTFIVPILAFGIVNDIVMASYRLRGMFFIPFAICLVGSLNLAHLLASLARKVAYEFLPPLSPPHFEEFQNLLQTQGPAWEPAILFSLVSVVFLAIAGRVWEEVEA